MTTFGVMGWPVEHSRSPRMHNAAFRHLDLPYVYGRFPVPPGALREAVQGARALGILGLNVTLPHKAAIMPLLDEVDDAARAIGAVNTVLNRGGRLQGSNTDAEGLVRALEEAGAKLSGARVTVLGAGGAARAAVYGAARAGAQAITVAARRRERAEGLLEALGPSLGACVTSSVDLGESLLGPFSETDLLIQATSATLSNGPHATAFAAALPMARLPATALVTDLVYDPERTTVLEAALARGLTTAGGLGMLLHQGALAFEAFTGRGAPLEVMRAALTS